MIAAEALGAKPEVAVASQAVASDTEPVKGKKVKKETKKVSKKVSKTEVKKETKKEVKKETKKEASFGELLGVSQKIAESLKEAGIKSLADITKLEIEELTKIKGIGEKKAQKIIADAKKLS